MWYVLQKDIYSYTRNLYGRAGEMVLMISDHGDVLIVEGTGGGFPVKKSDVKEVKNDNKKDCIRL